MKKLLQRAHNQLNKNVENEKNYILSLPTWKYFLVYIPALFIIFGLLHLIAYLAANQPFDVIFLAIQAVGFAIFLLVFHKIGYYWKHYWKNK